MTRDLAPVLKGSMRPDWLSEPVAVVTAPGGSADAAASPMPDAALYAVCLTSDDDRCAAMTGPVTPHTRSGRRRCCCSRWPSLVRLVTMAWVPFPPTEGSLYYLDVARHLVSGEGLTTNVLWSYATPPMAVPRPAFDLWLPLASLIDAVPMLVAGPTHQAGQLGIAIVGAFIAPLTWAVARDAGSLDGLGARRTGAAAFAAGLLAAILGPWLIATAGPDSTVPFVVLGTLDALLIARLLRPGGSRPALGLLLGLSLGLTYLARQEVVWIGLTLLVLAVPVIARVTAGGRLRASLRLLAPVVGGGLVVVVPWLVRQQLTFGGASAGQLVDNLLLLRNEQIFAIHDTPTLAGWLAQGVAGIAGNVVRAVATQLTDTVILGAFPVGIAGLVSVVGLRHRRSLRTPSALVVLLLSGAITFVATALLFPVATLWGTFQHASGPAARGPRRGRGAGARRAHDAHLASLAAGSRSTSSWGPWRCSRWRCP